MREIKIGDKTIGLKATPLALLFYKQEFGHDLAGDLIKLRNIQDQPEDFDALLFLQIAWAMAKAANGLNKQFPTFINWLNELETFDISDTDTIQAIADEAVDGFFRAANKPQNKEK
ncbi:hypothetical protein [Tepidanaerobacter syntrophicus]|uniref:hypothetical protein n=1 Tax=Tepidanaerobacter syntrophicus TaxID=224999 RepID=UPI001BD2EDEA|nr:hypothetical protein [Tepidanaerobacter syntrophicus]